MNLEDLFKLAQGRSPRKHRDDDHHFGHGLDSDRDYRSRDVNAFQKRTRQDKNDHNDKFDISPIMRSILQNRTLLIGAIVVLLLLGLSGVAIFLAALPLIQSASTLLFENGLNGVVDTVMPYAEKMWKGSN